MKQMEEVLSCGVDLGATVSSFLPEHEAAGMESCS